MGNNSSLRLRSSRVAADQILMHVYNLTAIQRLPVIIIIFVSSMLLMNRKLSILTRDDFAIAHHVFPNKLRSIPDNALAERLPKLDRPYSPSQLDPRFLS